MSFCHSVEKTCLSVSLSNKNVILSFCRKNMSLYLSVEEKWLLMNLNRCGETYIFRLGNC